MSEHCKQDVHEEFGACYVCCNSCNYHSHRCHFCGSELDHNSYSYESGEGKRRHWLSDCRPDLVQHEIGELCTWRGLDTPECYAYQNYATNEWGTEHEHFHKDGPMA